MRLNRGDRNDVVSAQDILAGILGGRFDKPEQILLQEILCGNLEPRFLPVELHLHPEEIVLLRGTNGILPKVKERFVRSLSVKLNLNDEYCHKARALRDQLKIAGIIFDFCRRYKPASIIIYKPHGELQAQANCLDIIEESPSLSPEQLSLDSLGSLIIETAAGFDAPIEAGNKIHNSSKNEGDCYPVNEMRILSDLERYKLRCKIYGLMKVRSWTEEDVHRKSGIDLVDVYRILAKHSVYQRTITYSELSLVEQIALTFNMIPDVLSEEIGIESCLRGSSPLELEHCEAFADFMRIGKAQFKLSTISVICEILQERNSNLSDINSLLCMLSKVMQSERLGVLLESDMFLEIQRQGILEISVSFPPAYQGKGGTAFCIGGNSKYDILATARHCVEDFELYPEVYPGGRVLIEAQNSPVGLGTVIIQGKRDDIAFIAVSKKSTSREWVQFKALPPASRFKDGDLTILTTQHSLSKGILLLEKGLLYSIGTAGNYGDSGAPYLSLRGDRYHSMGVVRGMYKEGEINIGTHFTEELFIKIIEALRNKLNGENTPPQFSIITRDRNELDSTIEVLEGILSALSAQTQGASPLEQSSLEREIQIKLKIAERLKHEGTVDLRQFSQELGITESELARLIKILRPLIGEVCDVIERSNLFPTGIAKTRKIIHRDGDWHRTDHIMGVSEDGLRVAIQTRRDKEDRGGLFVTGHFAVGESAQESLCREMEEEIGVIGLDITRLYRVPRYFYKFGSSAHKGKPGYDKDTFLYGTSDRANREVSYLYLYIIYASEEQLLNLGISTEEVKGLRFVPWLDLIRDVFERADAYHSAAAQYFVRADLFDMLKLIDFKEKDKHLKHIFESFNPEFLKLRAQYIAASPLFQTREGKYWLNIKFFESLLEGKGLVVGSARYLADDLGFVPLDNISDIDIISLQESREDLLEKLIEKLNDYGVAFAKLDFRFTRIKIKNKYTRIQMLLLAAWQSDDPVIRAGVIEQEDWFYFISNTSVAREFMDPEYWMKKYISVEYYFGNPDRYKRNRNTFLGCDKEEDIYRLRDNMLGSGDLSNLIQEVKKLTPGAKYERVRARIYGEVKLHNTGGSPLDNGMVVPYQLHRDYIYRVLGKRMSLSVINEIVAFIKHDPELEKAYNQIIYTVMVVAEYRLEDHVRGLFRNIILARGLEDRIMRIHHNLIPLFYLAVALHEIGEPRAIWEEIDKQHKTERKLEYTRQITSRKMSQWGFSKEEIAFVIGLNGNNVISRVIHKKMTVDDSLEGIIAISGNSQIPLLDIFELLSVYALLDMNCFFGSERFIRSFENREENISDLVFVNDNYEALKQKIVQAAFAGTNSGTSWMQKLPATVMQNYVPVMLKDFIVCSPEGMARKLFERFLCADFCESIYDISLREVGDSFAQYSLSLAHKNKCVRIMFDWKKYEETSTPRLILYFLTNNHKQIRFTYQEDENIEIEVFVDPKENFHSPYPKLRMEFPLKQLVDLIVKKAGMTTEIELIFAKSPKRLINDLGGRIISKDGNVVLVLGAALSASPLDIRDSGLYTGELILAVEEVMPCCMQKDSDWSRFSQIVNWLKRIKGLKILVIGGYKMPEYGFIDYTCCRHDSSASLCFLAEKFTGQKYEVSLSATAATIFMENINQHVKNGIGLLLSCYNPESKILTIGCMDNGRGFWGNDGKKITVSEAITLGGRRGKGTIKGIALHSIINQSVTGVTIIEQRGESVAIKHQSKNRLLSIKNNKPIGLNIIWHHHYSQYLPGRRPFDQIEQEMAFCLEQKISAIRFGSNNKKTADPVCSADKISVTLPLAREDRCEISLANGTASALQTVKHPLLKPGICYSGSDKFRKLISKEISRLFSLGLYDEIGCLPGYQIVDRTENGLDDCIVYAANQLGIKLYALFSYEKLRAIFLEISLHDAKNNDLVTYVHTSGLVAHYGIYLGDGIVKSKLDKAHVYSHPIWLVPLIYGQPKIFRLTISGKNLETSVASPLGQEQFYKMPPHAKINILGNDLLFTFGEFYQKVPIPVLHLCGSFKDISKVFDERLGAMEFNEPLA
ncbi:NUDIX domain-containing protein, partial [bacterium]